MYEVYARLTFNEPCLGNERFQDPEPNRMCRGDDGAVVFQPHWWRTALSKAASVCSVSKQLAERVVFHPEVDGTLGTYRRYYKAGSSGEACKFKVHEAFNRGDTVGVKALLPDELSIDEFRELLGTVGAYFGMSPFGWRRGFGRFSVKEVGNVYGRGSHGERAREPDVDQSGNGAAQGTAGTEDDGLPARVDGDAV